MKIQLLAAGTKAPDWVRGGVLEYQKRMPHECQLEIKDIPVARRTKTASIDKLKREEEAKLLQQINKGAHVVAMDRSGTSWSTEKLADKLRLWMSEKPLVQVLIGGPDGLSDGCLDSADECWSLSPLTFPHFLVRIVLAEQFYRAWSITANHPYRK